MKRQKLIEKSTPIVQKKGNSLVNPKTNYSKSSTYSLIEKYPFLIVVGFISIILMFVMWDFITIHKLFLYKDIGSDSVNVDYPAMILGTNMAKENWFSTWSFYMGMGYPYFSGVPNPLNPLFYLFSLLNPVFELIYGSNPALIRAPQFFIAFVIIGILAFLYFRTLKLNTFVSVAGSVFVTFMGYSIAGISWLNFGEVFCGIFLLFAFEQLFKKNRWYFLPIAIILLSNNPFNVYIYCFFLAIYSIFRFIDEKGFDVKEGLILFAKMSGLVLLGLLINFVNEWPWILNAMNSPRVTGQTRMLSDLNSMGKLPYEHATQILRTFSSDMLGTGNDYKGWYNYLEAPLFYCGLSCLLLLPQIFVFSNTRERIINGIFIGFWLSVILFPPLRHAIHLNLGDYYKIGINFFIPIVIIFMAMKALNKIYTANKIDSKVLIITFAVLFIAIITPYKVPGINIKLKFLIFVFLLAYTSVLLALNNESLRNYAKVAFLVVIGIEAFLFSNISVNERETYTAQEFKNSELGFKDNTIPAVIYLKQNNSNNFFRIEKQYSSGSTMHSSLNDAQAQAYFGTAIYSSFNQAGYIKFLAETNVVDTTVETQTRWAPGLKARPLLATLASVKFQLSKEKQPFLLNAGYTNDTIFGDVKLLKNNYALPLGFCYDTFISSLNFKKLGNPLQKDITLLRSCIVDNPDNFKSTLKEFNLNDTITQFNFDLYKTYTTNLKIDTLSITKWNQHYFEGSISIDKSKILFFSIPFDKGWKAYDNGKLCKIEVVNVCFMGLSLASGSHSIVLKHEYPNLFLGLIISGIAILIFLGLILFTAEFSLSNRIFIVSGLVIAYAMLFILHAF